MATILINDKHEIKGNLSVSREVVDIKTHKLLISGILSAHSYIEEIYDIEIPRLKLSKVTVLKESFGSDDFNIIYDFIAEELEVKGTEDEGMFRIISKIEQDDIEKEIYKKDHFILGSFEEE